MKDGPGKPREEVCKKSVCEDRKRELDLLRAQLAAAPKTPGR